MKISEVIEKLQLIKKQKGNVEVYADADTFSSVDSLYCRVDIVEYDKLNNAVYLMNDYDPENDWDDEYEYKK